MKRDTIMKRKTLPLALAGVLLMALVVTAGYAMGPDNTASSDALSAANALVTAGHPAEAIAIYEQLVEEGVQDAVVFYNLGNAYFQAGKPNQAVLNYQRAARLDPRDSDIRHNLALAREQAGLAVEPAQDPFHVLADLSQRWLTLDELALLALGTWFLLGFLTLTWRELRPKRASAGLRAAMALALLLVILSGVSLAGRMASEGSESSPTRVAEQVALLGVLDAGQPVQ